MFYVDTRKKLSMVDTTVWVALLHAELLLIEGEHNLLIYLK